MLGIDKDLFLSLVDGVHASAGTWTYIVSSMCLQYANSVSIWQKRLRDLL